MVYKTPLFRAGSEQGSPEGVLYFHLSGGEGNPAHIRLEQHWWPAVAYVAETLRLTRPSDLIPLARMTHPRINAAEAVRLFTVQTLMSRQGMEERTQARLTADITKVVADAVNDTWARNRHFRDRGADGQ